MDQFFPASKIRYLQVEKILIVTRLEPKQVGVILGLHLLEHCIEREHNNVQLLNLGLEIHPVYMSLFLLVLSRPQITVEMQRRPFARLTFTFLEAVSKVNLPALTWYLD